VVWSNRSRLDTMSKLQLLAGLAQLLACSISLLCQLIDPRLELSQYRRRLIRCRELGLRRFGSLVVGAGRQLVSEVTFQVRLGTNMVTDPIKNIVTNRIPPATGV
jgi:hypothetical protein